MANGALAKGASAKGASGEGASAKNFSNMVTNVHMLTKLTVGTSEHQLG